MNERTRARFARYYGRFWLPLYLLVGVSWLLGPAVAHERYGTLRLISGVEALHGVAGATYRLADITAAILLLTATWAFRISHRSLLFGKAILFVAILSAIDGLFPDTCYISHTACGLVSTGVSTVHDIETVALAGLVGVVSIIDSVRHRRLPSIGFVLLQLSFAAILLVNLVSSQTAILLQYIYETALIVWLGWLLDRFNPVRRPLRHQRTVRRIVAGWVGLSGMFALVTSIPHVDFVEDWQFLAHSPSSLLLAQQGMVAGILLLYVARHLLRGERPALWLAIVIFYSQIIKYSLLTPQPAGVAVYVLLMAMLVYSRRGFDRNTVAPTWASRLIDIGVIFAGTLVAVVAAVVIISVSGHLKGLQQDIHHFHGVQRQAVVRGTAKEERTEARFRAVVQALGIGLLSASLWSLFRPKSVSTVVATADKEKIMSLLAAYSDNSEDYFKIWPTDKRYFSRPHAEGMLAYKLVGGIAFVLADPIASNRMSKQYVFDGFLKFARQQGWVVSVFIIGGGSPDIYEHAGLSKLRIGSSAVIEVEEYNSKTKRNKWWRWQQNRAERNGWTYERQGAPHSGGLVHELKSVSDAWLENRARREQGFSLGYWNETYMQACTIHCLRDADGKLLAFANEVPIFGKTRRKTVDLIRFLPEYQGVMPILLMHILETMQGGQYRQFDLGFVPLAHSDNELLRVVRQMMGNRFSSAGLEQFKNKFEPAWQPDYIAYDGDILDLARIAGSLEHLMRVEHNHSNV